jgi:hypothetical protein
VAQREDRALALGQVGERAFQALAQLGLAHVRERMRCGLRCVALVLVGARLPARAHLTSRARSSADDNAARRSHAPGRAGAPDSPMRRHKRTKAS